MSIVRTIKPFGEFTFDHSQSTWFTFARSFSPANIVELTIEVENSTQELSDQILLIKEFASEMDYVMSRLYEFISKKLNKTVREVKTMYFLAAIELKNDNKTWHITFEPSSDTKTIYNYFLRFTLINNEIIWSNLTENKGLV